MSDNGTEHQIIGLELVNWGFCTWWIGFNMSLVAVWSPSSGCEVRPLTLALVLLLLPSARYVVLGLNFRTR